MVRSFFCLALQYWLVTEQSHHLVAIYPTAHVPRFILVLCLLLQSQAEKYCGLDAAARAIGISRQLLSRVIASYHVERRLPGRYVVGSTPNLPMPVAFIFSTYHHGGFHVTVMSRA